MVICTSSVEYIGQYWLVKSFARSLSSSVCKPSLGLQLVVCEILTNLYQTRKYHLTNPYLSTTLLHFSQNKFDTHFYAVVSFFSNFILYLIFFVFFKAKFAQELESNVFNSLFEMEKLNIYKLLNTRFYLFWTDSLSAKFDFFPLIQSFKVSHNPKQLYRRFLSNF